MRAHVIRTKVLAGARNKMDDFSINFVHVRQSHIMGCIVYGMTTGNYPAMHCANLFSGGNNKYCKAPTCNKCKHDMMSTFIQSSVKIVEMRRWTTKKIIIDH